MKSEDENNKLLKVTFLSGMIAGIIGKFSCHPLDTIRAKISLDSFLCLQINSNSKHTIKNDNMIKKVYLTTMKNEGLRGFYKGAGITIVGTGPAYSLYLWTFEYSKFQLTSIKALSSYPSFISFSSGMLAETVSCMLWLPIDVIKERMQVQSNLKIFDYKNTIDAISKIIKSEGIVGLYRAYGATVASFGPFSAFYFMFYEKFKSFLSNPQFPTFTQSLILSGSAGALAGLVCNPLDIVKLRMQVQRASKANQSSEGNFGYKNLVHGLYKIVTNEGILSLTKGSLVRVLYACPNTAISMSMAEITRAYLIKHYIEINH